MFKVNKRTGKVEMDKLTISEYGFIESVLIPEFKKQEMSKDEVYYKIKSLEARIRDGVQRLIALEELK